MTCTTSWIPAESLTYVTPSNAETCCSPHLLLPVFPISGTVALAGAADNWVQHWILMAQATTADDASFSGPSRLSLLRVLQSVSRL